MSLNLAFAFIKMCIKNFVINHYASDFKFMFLFLNLCFYFLRVYQIVAILRNLSHVLVKKAYHSVCGNNKNDSS